MEITFAGICCWVAAPAGGGKTVIIRNALRGGFHQSVIPAHTAFIEAIETQLDLDPQKTTWDADLSMKKTRFYFLDGFHITFDPMPSGGTIDIRNLPHVAVANGTTPICEGADEIRDGFLNSPRADAVLGLVHVPAGMVTTMTNGNQAVFASLSLPQQPLKIIATSFDGSVTKQIYVKDGSARIYIANVDFDSRLNMQGADEDTHKYLYCDMFRPQLTAMSPPMRMDRAVAHDPTARTAEAAVLVNRTAVLEKISLDLLTEPARRDPKDFYDSLAAGCSNSQWP